MKTILFLAVSFLTLSLTYGQTNDWAFHYNFDGNALDDGPNQNHGIIKGVVVPVEDRFQQQGKAIAFDGTSGYILIPYSESLNLPTTAFSFSVWIKLNDYHKTNYWDFIKSDMYAPIFCKSESDQTFQYRLCLNGSGYEFDGVRDNMMTGVVKNNGAIIKTGTWQMLTLTYDGAEIKMFIDSNLVDAQLYQNNFIADTHPLVIGKDLPGALEYLNGSLDDFAVWNKALAQNEIKRFYETQLEKPALQPVTTPPVLESFATKTGANVVLKNVHFVQSRAELLPTSYQELDMLVETMKSHPTIMIEISGHTDNVGNRLANVALSETRAVKVSQYLMAHGIEKRRIETVGYGPDKPLTKNKSEEERRQNRRVEFRILSE